jgi:hypothetical protein
MAFTEGRDAEVLAVNVAHGKFGKKKRRRA